MKTKDTSDDMSEYQVLMEEIKKNNNVLGNDQKNRRRFLKKRSFFSADFLWYLFFRNYGRIGRAEYFIGNIMLSSFILVSLFLLLSKAESLDINETTYSITISFVLLLGVVGNINLNIKRAHDLDRSGLSLLLWLILPITNIIMLISLHFIMGTKGENFYGQDPLCN